MSLITKPISIAWGVPTTALFLTVTDTAATELRARAGVGTTDSRGNLGVAIAGWDTTWRGFAVVDDGAGNSYREAFEPGPLSAAETRAAIGLAAADLDQQLESIADETSGVREVLDTVKGTEGRTLDDLALPADLQVTRNVSIEGKEVTIE